ncbi:MAG: M1 family aminopeptidase [Pseudomonadota bacterium]
MSIKHNRLLIVLATLVLIVGCKDAAPKQNDNLELEESDATVWADTAPNGRLPRTVQPTAYTLDLTIDPREPEFHGSVTIDLAVTAAADHIWLHGNRLSVEEAYIETGAGERIRAEYGQVLETGVARISLPSEISVGQHKLTLKYRAPFDPNLAGMFRVERGGDWYALAKSESVQARKAVPGFDEPGFKAPWDITLTVPADYAAIAISPVRSRTPAEAGFDRVVFETSRPTSTYLLSFAVGPFDEYEVDPLPPSSIRDYEIPLAGWARRGKSEELAFIMSLTRDMVEYFEEVTRTPYPYQKLDIIAAPDWPSGATELASSPTYREEIILSNGEPGPVKKRRIVSIHAHELAHMWFGDLVTPPWWNDLWLKEGFAVWGTPPASSAWNPDGGYELNATRDAIDGLRADSLATARAVREPISRNEDIRSAYDGITYDKGSAILRMAEVYLGPETWRSGLKAYFERFKDDAADANDFTRVMGEAAGDGAFEASLNSFLNQNGAPYLRFEHITEGDNVPALRVRQTRYRPLGSTIQGKRSWITPVCVRHSSGVDCGLIEGDTGVIELNAKTSPKWILPNADGAGYYRFAVQPENWSALIENFDAVSASEALIAIDSASAGFEAGQLDAAALLSLVETAADAANLEIRWEAASLLRRYSARLYGSSDEKLAELSAYARELFSNQYVSLDDASTETASLYRQRLRGFLAETAGDQNIRTELAKAVSDYIGIQNKPDLSALSADDFPVAAKIGVETYGTQFLETFFSNRGEINNASFNRAVLSAAGQVDNAEYRDRLMKLSLSDELEPSESFTLIASLMGNEDAQQTVWTWIQSNAEAIAAKAPAQWRRRVPALAGQFCDTRRITELDAFIESKGDLFPGHERGVAQARESIALCEALRDTKSKEFAETLSRRSQ